MRDLKLKGAILLTLNVTQTKNCQQVVDVILKESGGIDILINNAGFGLFKAIEDVASEIARKQFDVNLFGLMNLPQMILSVMRKNKKR